MLANPVTTTDMDFEERLKMDWFSRRAEQNEIIKDFLLDKIYYHQPEIDVVYTAEFLRNLTYEDLLELAIGCVNKDITITLGYGSDFDDYSDAKFTTSQFRNNDKKRGSWTHTFSVPGTKHKEGLVRICGYNTIDKKFYFFCIPANEIQGKLEIVIHNKSGLYEKPNFDYGPERHRKWWDYECASFEEMAKIKKPPSKINQLFQIS